MRAPLSALALTLLAGTALVGARAQAPAFMPIDEVREGMVGVGRTVFSGGDQEEFRATVLGVLKNINGPRRDLILARLEGGPLANTGVIQGMSGSPVYVDGRLIGAVSYSLGSFPKEPLAGITPIDEMTQDIGSAQPRPAISRVALQWPAAPEAVFGALERIATQAAAPIGQLNRDWRLEGPDSLLGLAPTLRPIGAAVVLRGFEPIVDRQLRDALTPAGSVGQTANGAAGIEAPATAATTLRPGDPVGMTLMRGDLEMGATGTVTHVDGNRVYAFGHPYLNLGPASMAMTRAHVFAVLPSLSSSMKIATLGDVIGTFTQDRATAVGGLLGAGPPEMEVRLSLSSDRAPAREFRYFVLHDPSLTPLVSYVSILNSLFAYERQTGAMSVVAKGAIAFEGGDQVAIDDVFTGDAAATDAAAAIMTPIGEVVANEFRDVMPERMDLSLRITEAQQRTAIERVWLDTTRPELGGQYRVQIQLKDYRGGRRQIAVPITMPSQASGPLTLLVSDARTLGDLEQRELDPGAPTSWADLIDRLNDARHNSTVYVRLISASPGTVVDGETLPALPASVQAVLQADTTSSHDPVSKTVVGAWEQRLDMAVTGSRELTVTLRPPR